MKAKFNQIAERLDRLQSRADKCRLYCYVDAHKGNSVYSDMNLYISIEADEKNIFQGHTADAEGGYYDNPDALLNAAEGIVESIYQTWKEERCA